MSGVVKVLYNIFMQKTFAVRPTMHGVNCMEISRLCDEREDKWFHDGKHGGLLLIYASPTELPLCHTHTSAADPQEAFLLRRQRSGTLLSEALSHAGVCCVWSWKPDPFSFKNTVPPPPHFPVYRGNGIQ